MRGPDQLRTWAEKKYATNHRSWLGFADEAPPGLALGFPTDPPNEAVAAADPAASAAWVQSWTDFERSAPADVEVQWSTRRWAGFGTQRLPVRVAVRSPTAVAALAGQRRSWQRLLDRADLLQAAWLDREHIAGALPGMAAKLARLEDADLPRLIATVNWFLANPESGLLARQVPVEGVDTKWLERHTDLVRRLVVALGGDRALGLRVEPRRFRVRVFDGSELTDFTAPAAELAALSWAPQYVLLVENRDSMAPLSALPGVVAVHAQGLAAPELAVVGWIAHARVLYWGDLDSHGFRILSLVRQVLPGTESLLMDRATLTRFAALAGVEPVPFRADIGYLTPEESATLRVLRQGDLRLEQERIPWPHVVHTITSTLSRDAALVDRGLDQR